MACAFCTRSVVLVDTEGKELGMFTLEVTGAGVTVTARTGAALVGGAGRYSGQERGGRSS